MYPFNPLPSRSPFRNFSLTTELLDSPSTKKSLQNPPYKVPQIRNPTETLRIRAAYIVECKNLRLEYPNSPVVEGHEMHGHQQSVAWPTASHLPGFEDLKSEFFGGSLFFCGDMWSTTPKSLQNPQNWHGQMENPAKFWQEAHQLIHLFVFSLSFDRFQQTNASYFQWLFSCWK